MSDLRKRQNAALEQGQPDTTGAEILAAGVNYRSMHLAAGHADADLDIETMELGSGERGLSQGDDGLDVDDEEREA